MEESLDKFLNVVSDLRARLDNLKTNLEEREGIFKKVETNMGIFRRLGGSGKISMGVDAELIRPLKDDLYSAGLSLTLYKNGDNWTLEGGIGWSSYLSGFDEISDYEKSDQSINCLLDEMMPALEELQLKFVEMIRESCG